MPTEMTELDGSHTGSGSLRRRVGAGGPLVGAIGLGCMALSGEYYGAFDDRQGAALIGEALDLGATMIDTADFYGDGHNERLVGRALRGRRDQAFLATKFGIRREAGHRWNDNDPAYVRSACEASLRRLDVDCIDLYYLHRLDGRTPLEDTVGAMSDLVTAGKVRYLGLSEVSAANLRRAHAVHPVAAVQSELSLWTRDVVERGVAAAAADLGSAVVAYSPLGRGFLTGTVRDRSVLATNDFRRGNPRFAADALDHNLALLEVVSAVAAAHGCGLGQVALAWVLAQGPRTFAIPGTRHRDHVRENVAAASLHLTSDEITQLTIAFLAEHVAGERYPAEIMPDIDTAPWAVGPGADNGIASEERES